MLSESLRRISFRRNLFKVDNGILVLRTPVGRQDVSPHTVAEPDQSSGSVPNTPNQSETVNPPPELWPGPPESWQEVLARQNPSLSYSGNSSRKIENRSYDGFLNIDAVSGRARRAARVGTPLVFGLLGYVLPTGEISSGLLAGSACTTIYAVSKAVKIHDEKKVGPDTKRKS